MVGSGWGALGRRLVLVLVPVQVQIQVQAAEAGGNSRHIKGGKREGVLIWVSSIQEGSTAFLDER